MRDESLGGLISGILTIFISRYEKRKSNNNVGGNGGQEKSTKNSPILEPFLRILNGYASEDGKVNKSFLARHPHYRFILSFLTFLLAFSFFFSNFCAYFHFYCSPP